MIYFLFAVVYLFLIAIQDKFQGEFVFVIKIIFISLYLVYEIIGERKRNTKYWRLSPAVLASLLTFLLSFTLTNLIFLLPGTPLSNWFYNKFGPHPFPILNKALDLVMFGAFFMWFGYKSKAGDKIFNIVVTKIIDLRKYFRKSFRLNYLVIVALVLGGILARLYAIKIGIFGYSQTPEQVIEYSKISQIINYIEILTQICLTAVALAYFSDVKNLKTLVLLILIIMVQIFFGILSGMKSNVVMPALILFVSYLVVNNRVNKALLLASGILIFVAYMIIQPFRDFRNMDRNYQSDPSYIINTVVDAYNYKGYLTTGEQNTESIFYSFISRMNYITDASRAIEYKDQIGLMESDPDFADRLYTTPFQALIPRAVWTSKPEENIGNWFNTKVWNRPIGTSVAMSPFGFLYFAGGYTFVVLFFFIFGIMQKLLLNFLKFGPGGAIIFISLLSSVVLLNSSVNSIFVSWIRNLPILIILQHYMLKK